MGLATTTTMLTIYTTNFTRGMYTSNIYETPTLSTLFILLIYIKPQVYQIDWVGRMMGAAAVH